MNKYCRTGKKKWLQGIFLAAVLFFSCFDAAEAADDKGKTAPQPISVYADYVHYDQLSGDVFAEGNVRVVQGGETILADRVDGNAKTGDIRTRTTTEFQSPENRTRLFGESVDYNYNKKTGKIMKVHGKSGNQNVEADNIDILEDHMSAHDTMITRCSAKGTKCQHITAKRVDIWPNDKVIAYDVDVYLLGHKLVHRGRYITRMDSGDKQVPRIGYDDDYGIYIAQTLEFPIDRKLSLGADLLAGTEMGGRSMGWANWQEKNFNVRYSYGYTEDDDNEWIKKENNIRIDYPYKKLFGLPINYNLWYERGLWKSNSISSWHMEAGIYLSGDPIYLSKGKSFWLNLGTGYRRLEESYNSIDQNEYRYDIGLTKRISGKWRVGAVYSDVKNNVNLFDYNSIDVDQSLTYTINWQPDHLNGVSFAQQWDTNNHRLYKNTVRYTRNLHCWEIVLSYERERPLGGKYDNKFHWELNLAI